MYYIFSLSYLQQGCMHFKYLLKPCPQPLVHFAKSSQVGNMSSFWHHSMLSIMEHSIFLPQILCMACLFYSKKKKRFLRVAPTSESSFSNQWYEAIPFHPIKLSICCRRMCSYLHSPWSCGTDTEYISKLSLFFLSYKNLIYLSS